MVTHSNIDQLIVLKSFSQQLASLNAGVNVVIAQDPALGPSTRELSTDAVLFILAVDTLVILLLLSVSLKMDNKREFFSTIRIIFKGAHSFFFIAN